MGIGADVDGEHGGGVTDGGVKEPTVSAKGIEDR
jgi:hypothetical protein